MKHLRDIIGYLLGLVLFVGLMPTLMWLSSSGSSSLPSCLSRYSAKSAACIKTLAKSMTPIAVILEDSKISPLFNDV